MTGTTVGSNATVSLPLSMPNANYAAVTSANTPSNDHHVNTAYISNKSVSNFRLTTGWNGEYTEVYPASFIVAGKG